MSEPFFSIVIPTKNRPGRLADSVRSVLAQTYDDFEIVVCDNSDEAETAETANAVREFDDPRIRYVRTSGELSMPDNWERAVSEARGEYVGILTDRSVFRRDALQVIATEIEQTGAKCVSWFNDLYGRDSSRKSYKRRQCTLKRHRIDRDDVLDFFIHGDPKYATKIVPKLMTCVCHRPILDEIRATVGRVCPPVAPDFTSGFLMLAHLDWILKLDEALYVSCGTGNGADFRKRGELAERFRQDLGMTWEEMVDRMPSDACFAHALVLNDLVRVRDMVPERLPNLEIDKVQYYLGCLNDYVKTSRRGVTRTEDLDILIAALEREPDEIQRRVRDTRLYTATFATEPATPSEEKASAGPLMFDTVFDALAWDEANPRKPIAESFLDLRPAVVDIKKSRATDRMARRLAKRMAKQMAKQLARAAADERRQQAMPPVVKAQWRVRRVLRRVRATLRIRTRLRMLLRRG